MRSLVLLLLCLTGFLLIPVAGDLSDSDILGDPFYPDNAVALIAHATIQPEWISTTTFWYADTNGNETSWFVVNTTSLTNTPLCDADRISALLNGEPFSVKSVSPDLSSMIITSGEGRWNCTLATDSLEDASLPDETENGITSPDGKYIAYAKENNLWLYSVEDGAARQLTTDGAEDYFYGMESDSMVYAVTDMRLGTSRPTYLVWSPDSTKIRTFRCDQREVERFPMIQNAPENGQIRPILYEYHYPVPGDDHLPMYEPLIIDITSGAVLPVLYEPYPESSLMNSVDFGVWGPESDLFYTVFPERGEKTLRILEENAATGEVRELFTETGETYREANLEYGAAPIIVPLPGEDSVIWFSERDGWGHLYRFGMNGTLLNQVTRGEWVVQEFIRADPESGYLYLLGSGREDGNPYYRYLYRVHPDGTGLELLTPETGDHTVFFSPDGSTYVDQVSRVDLPTITTLHRSDGSLLMPVATADDSALRTAGFSYPEQVSVMARDGTTPLYGLVFRPSGMEEGKKYPVIDVVYPGPYTIVTRTAYPSDLSWSSKIFWICQMLAERGYIVVTMDGMGTAYRSKSFHDVSYGNIGDCGLADHVAGITDLANRYPEMDITRVGMYGKSAGGFMTAQALLTYPEFFKVGFAASGNHDSRLYASYWGEKYEGLPDSSSYTNEETLLKAENLTGHLFLMTGELDDNVHPSATFQLADALIREGKDFEMFVFPNRNHELNYDPFYLRKMIRHFERYL